MANETTTELLIRARNLTKEAFDAAERDLRKLRDETKKNSDRMRSFTLDTSKGLVGLRGELNNLAGAIGVTFGLQTLVSFTGELLRMGDQIVKVADRTGLTTDQVQRLQYVANQSGNTIEDLTSAIGQMQDRLASGDASAVAALKSLNLSFDELARMDPYSQMIAISEAIAKVPNPANQAQIAMDLFGRTGIAILPTIKAGMLDVAAAAPLMSEATVRSLDAAGDALDDLKMRLKVWAASGIELFTHFGDGLVIALFPAFAKIGDAFASVLETFLKVPGAEKVFSGLRGTVDGLRQSAQWYRDAAKAQELQLDRVAAATVRTEVPTAKLTVATKAHGDQARATTKAVQDSIPVSAAAAHAMGLLAKAHEHQEAALRLEAASWRAWESTVSTALQTIAKQPSPLLLQGRSLTGPVPQIGAPAASPGNMVGFVPPVVKDNIFASIFGTSAEFGARMSSTILGAIQGGGNAFGAAAGLLGQQLTTHMASAITGGAGIAIKGALGGAINAILPGLGALLGPLASKIGGFFAGLFDRNKGRDAVVKWAESLEGGFNGLQKKLQEMGREDLWKRVTQLTNNNSAAEARAAIDSVTKAIGEFDAAQGKLTADSAVPTIDEMRAAAERYGGTLDSLGPKVQAMAVTEMAANILADFKLMERGSADLGAMYSFTKDEIQDLLAQAQKTGAELPAALRPYLQEMVNAGLLTDAAGTKLEDLSGFKFDDALIESMGTLVKTMQDFVGAIRDGSLALGGLGSMRVPPIRVPVHFEDAGGPSLPAHDVGAYIREDHLARVHAGEIVGPVDFIARAMRQAGLLAGAGGGDTVVPIYLDGELLARKVVRRVPDQLRRFGVRRLTS